MKKILFLIFSFGILNFSQAQTTSDTLYLTFSEIGLYKELLLNIDSIKFNQPFNDSLVIYKKNGVRLMISGSKFDSISFVRPTNFHPTVSDYNGNQYPVVTIGTQVWMGADLRTPSFNDGTYIQSPFNDAMWANTTAAAFVPSFGAVSNGYLYNWYAVNSTKLCPTGWHVPTKEDWTILINALGGDQVAGIKLMTKEFKGTLSGIKQPSLNTTTSPPTMSYALSDINNSGNWWSSTADGPYQSNYITMLYNGFTYISTNNLQTGMYVRCLQNSVIVVNTIPSVSITATASISNTTVTATGNITSNGGTPITEQGFCWSTSSTPTINDQKIISGNSSSNLTAAISNLLPNTQYYIRAYARNNVGIGYGTVSSFVTTPTYSGTLTDIDGNVYPTIIIGTQTWMAKNLATTKLNDGTAIGYNTSPGLSSMWWFNNDAATYKNTYGGLYTGYAVITNKLCPVGWHVPSDDEWKTLSNYLGGDNVAGGKIKEIGNFNWQYPNSSATNSSGFTGVGAGYRYNINSSTIGGMFDVRADWGIWWSSTYAPSYAYSLWTRIAKSSDSILKPFSSDMSQGYSVRCVKN